MDRMMIARRLTAMARRLMLAAYDYLDDMDAEAKLAMLRKGGVPAGVLRKLCDDENEDVRIAVAESKSVPTGLLNSMLMDESMIVRTKAREALALRQG